jgi:hypothetical protein
MCALMVLLAVQALLTDACACMVTCGVVYAVAHGVKENIYGLAVLIGIDSLTTYG